MNAFLSTLPQGERRFSITARIASYSFLSTLPQGERLIWLSLLIIILYFYPRSRKGSDTGPLYGNLDIVNISIHAPARGATASSAWVKSTRRAFLSTLPQGERQEFRSRIVRGEEFLSTLPQGERPVGTRHIRQRKSISIHAPARGATDISHALIRHSTIFLSTLPQGERPVVPAAFPEYVDFYPRSRKGSDHTHCLEVFQFLRISIHAPARGATG